MSLLETFQILLRTPSNISEHMPMLAMLGRGRSVVEFGFSTGRSATAFLAGGCAKLVSYDILDCSAAAAPLKSERFTFVQADSAAVEIEECDVLFIDSLHTGAHLTKELTKHAGKARQMIAMHDTWCRKFKDMHAAVDRFLAAHPEWRVLMDLQNCNGLTVLERVA